MVMIKTLNFLQFDVYKIRYKDIVDINKDRYKFEHEEIEIWCDIEINIS